MKRPHFPCVSQTAAAADDSPFICRPGCDGCRPLSQRRSMVQLQPKRPCTEAKHATSKGLHARADRRRNPRRREILQEFFSHVEARVVEVVRGAHAAAAVAEIGHLVHVRPHACDHGAMHPGSVDSRTACVGIGRPHRRSAPGRGTL